METTSKIVVRHTQLLEYGIDKLMHGRKNGSYQIELVGEIPDGLYHYPYNPKIMSIRSGDMGDILVEYRGYTMVSKFKNGFSSGLRLLFKWIYSIGKVE